MEDKNGVLAKLHDEVCVVKSAEDLHVGDIIYVQLDSADGINTQGYPTRLKYVVVSGAKLDRKQIAAVLINSENDYSSDPEWQNEQYLLSQKNYANFWNTTVGWTVLKSRNSKFAKLLQGKLKRKVA